MMSSYHILNALWVGIFPMIAVSIVIGIVIYMSCCLNNIKERCFEYYNHRKPKEKQQKKKKSKEDIEANYKSEYHSSRKKTKTEDKYKSEYLSDDQKMSNQPKKSESKGCCKLFYEDYYDDDDDIKQVPSRKLLPKPEVEEYLTLNSVINQNLISVEQQIPPPLPLTVPPPQPKNKLECLNRIENSVSLEKHINTGKDVRFDRSSLKLDLKTNNNNKLKSIHLDKPSANGFIIEELDSEPVVLLAGLDKSTVTRSLNTSETKKSTNEIDRNSKTDQLIVQELKESPKGIYARLKCLKNKKKKNSSVESPVITDIGIFPNSTILELTQHARLSPSLIYDNEKTKIKGVEKNYDNFSLNSSSIICSQSINTYENSTDSDNSIFNKRVQENFLKKSYLSPKRLRKHVNNPNKTSSNNSALTSPNLSKSNRNLTNKRSNNKRKKKALIKNRVQSDLEIEENMIFNDDDNDSISSNGLCNEALKSQKGSQGTLTNRSFVNLRSKKISSLEDDSTEDKIPNVDKQKILADSPKYKDTARVLANSSNHLRSTPPTARINMDLSISDIDPDDNILKNMLIKKP